jgi:hypothetical protein
VPHPQLFPPQLLTAMFNTLSPWLGLFSATQVPLMMMMRITIFKGKRLGNLIVWFGLVTGIPLVTVLYSLKYCANGACRK